MKIKVGDNVKIMIGKSAGKTGKVIQVLPADRQVVVEGLHQKKKHLRPQKQGEKGQILEFSAPLPLANVQLICSKCNKITRIGFRLLENGKKERKCNKCKEAI